MKATELNDILKDIKALKLKLVKAQEYEQASYMRDMQKLFLDKKDAFKKE